MALPSFSKSWIFKRLAIPQSGAQQTDFFYGYYLIKQGLTTASGWTDQAGNAATNSYPWQVVASCDTSATSTSVDLWDSAAKVT